jgi:hypothetical protein
MAFTSGELGTFYLDRQTGEVLSWSSEHDEPEHIQQVIDRIDAEPDRYLRIEPCDSRTEWGWMADFIDTVTEPRLEQQLALAIRGRGAFRRFKDVLVDYPAERERWFAYWSERLRADIRRWLEANDVEAEAPPEGRSHDPG